MKSIDDLMIPENLRYTETHEWAKSDGEDVLAGITDFAQDQLGSVVWVEFPEIGDCFKAGEVFGSIESAKAVSEILMPVDGEIIEVNSSLEDDPAKLNSKPYDAWLIRIKTKSGLDGLLTKDQIQAQLKL